MSRSSEGEALARSVDTALRACRRAMDVTVESTGPNHPMREAKRALADAIDRVRARKDLALETALADLDERLTPYAEGTRLLSVARLEELERFLGRAEVLFRLAQHSSAKHPTRARPLPLAARPRGVARLDLDDDEVEAGRPATMPMRARVEQEVYEEVVGVFALEARDQLDRLSAALRRLERDGMDVASRVQIRDRMRAMKSSSSLVGVEDVRRVAHAGEDFAQSLLQHGAEEVDLTLLAELHRALETLTLGDGAARSTVDREALVERVEERIGQRDREESAEPNELGRRESDSSDTSADGAGDLDSSMEPAPTESAFVQEVSEKDGPEQEAAARRLGEALNQQGPPEAEPDPRIAASDPAFRMLSEVENAVTLVERRREALVPLGRDLRRSASRSSEVLALLREERGGAPSADDLELAREGLAEVHREIEASELQLALGSTGIENEIRALRRHTQRLGHRLDDLARTSLEPIASNLERLVRSAAEREGKQVGLELQGFDTPLDQGIASALAESLRHLARNAVEHGIERAELRRLRGKPTEGRVRIEVRRDGPRVLVDVTDDGRGFQQKELVDAALRLGESPQLAGASSDGDLWQLATLSGISTRQRTAGAGLDLVRARIESLGGGAELVRTGSGGSTIRFSVPVELTVQRALFLESRGRRLAIASGSVVRVVRRPGDVCTNGGTIDVDGLAHEVVDLGEWLDGDGKTGDVRGCSLVLLEDQERRIALRVERVWDAGELPIYPKGPLLERYSGIGGFGRTESGDVIPVVDALALVRGDRPGRHAQIEEADASDAQPGVLVVDDAPSVLRVVGLLLQRLGVRPLLAGDGREALRLLQAETEPPWMALVDVAMPEMDGFELTQAIRARGHDSLPIYLFTSPSGALPPTDDHDIEGYVFKPLVRRELAALLSRHRDADPVQGQVET